MCISLNFNFLMGFEPTVSNVDYIRKEIEKLKISTDLSFDDLKNTFIESPIYAVECYIDNSIEKSDKDKEEFSEFLPIETLYKALFKVDNYDLGYNLLVEMVPIQNKPKFNQTIYGHLECISSTKGCSSLNLKNVRSINNIFPKSNENHNEPLNIETSWDFHIKSKNIIYAELNVILSVKKYNFIGTSTTTKSNNNSYLCLMKFESQSI